MIPAMSNEPTAREEWALRISVAWWRDSQDRIPRTPTGRIRRAPWFILQVLSMYDDMPLEYSDELSAITAMTPVAIRRGLADLEASGLLADLARLREELRP